MIETSDRPEAAAGRVILRAGNAVSGTAHEPGAMECPSDSATVGGNPRTLMKLPLGTASDGPTRMASGTWLAGSADMVLVTETVGRDVWA
jgi:hypothetical protein